MKLKTMTATFGKLEQASLTLGEGLNILEGPNEGGKSTWAGFLRAMLYGIDTRDRDKKGHLAEKNRYLPWSGSPMEGEITLEWGGRDITIRRFRKGANPFGGFSAVYTGTTEPVPGLTGDNCGLMLTGVGREVFERSAFIGQGNIGVTSTPDLEKRIAALVSSGEEDVSFSQTEARLREWANRRRVNKTVGMLPKLEAELEENRRQQSHLTRVTAAISKAEGEKNALLHTKRELEGELHIHQRIAQQALNQRFALAHQEYEQAAQVLAQVEKDRARFGELPDKERLKKAQGELQYMKVLADEIKSGETAYLQAEEEYVQANIAIQDKHFQGLTADEARRRVADDQKNYGDKLSHSAKQSKLFAILHIVGLLLGGGIAAAGALGVIPPELNIPQYGPYAAGAGIYVLCALFALAFSNGKKRSRDEARAILTRYGVDAPDQLAGLAEDYAARWAKSEACAQRSLQLHGALNDHKARRENGVQNILDFVHSFAPEVTDLFGCSAALSLALGLEDRLRESRERVAQKRRHRDDLEAQGGQLMDTLELLHTPDRTAEETAADLEAVQWELDQVNRALDMARGEQKAVGDPAALSAREEALTAMIARREREYEALTIAAQALTAANARMQERFSPELGRLAGQWMSRLTGGKYTAVTLNRELEASATQRDGLLPRRALELSRGTVDQLYLAVRLAVCQLCLPGEDAIPVVLDDALVAFDDTRMGQALDCLEELGDKRQVLLFTCQSREGRYAAGRQAVTRTAI